MSKVVQLPSFGPRAEDIKAIQDIVPDCVAATVAEVGLDGLKALFDGYKESVELQKRAA